MVLVQTQLIGDRSGYRLGVTGQHHGLADACGLQAPDGLRAVGLDHVCDEQITGVLPLDGHMHEGARLGHFRGGEAQFCHQAGVAGGNGFAVHLCCHAVAAQLLDIGDAAGVDVPAVSGLDAQGDGVFGPALGQGGGLHEGVFGDTVFGVDAHDLEGALGQGAGLIKDHDPGAGQLFQIGGAFDEDAAGAGTADAAEEAQRDGDDQSAGAGDDEEGQSAIDPVAEAGGLAHQQQDHRRDERQSQCAVADGGGVHAGKTGDEVLGAGLLHAGIFHEVEDLGDRGLAKFLAGAHLEQAGHVHTAADDLVAGLHIAGQALAGQGCGVQGRSALHDHAVDGHTFAGLDHDHGADFDIIGVHLFQLAVCVLDVGVVGADVHQAGDALAAFADGHALEQLTDLVKEDDGAALDIVAQRERAHGGNGHQEALVERLAVLDALERLAQDIPAHHEVRDEVEHQLHRGGECGQELQDHDQDDRCDDLIQHLFLLFGHTILSF